MSASSTLAPLDAAMAQVGDRGADLAYLYRLAQGASLGKNTVANFEVVFTSDGHPFDELRAPKNAKITRRSVRAAEFITIARDDALAVVGAFQTPHEGVYQALHR